ncbi:MAG TPA: AAA family ATPase [Cytophagales bacterium]|nr:AAA family ATPase [Cytophagales bacterium]
MYLSQLEIWNFRKYGERLRPGMTSLTGLPGLSLKFNPSLNLLVGENDSGKTTIIDAIKLILQTQSHDYYKVTFEDFYLKNGEVEDSRVSSFKIECIFKDFTAEEASHFVEWLGIENDQNATGAFFLKVSLIARRRGNSIFIDTKAGPDEGTNLTGEARDYLRLTYLKPLRDAETELAPSRYSKLSQILDNHKSFKEKKTHPLVGIAEKANASIANFFKGKESDGVADHPDSSGKLLVDQINTYLKDFFGEDKQADFSLADAHLKGVLEKLSLKLSQNKSGLGSHNLLFIATELLLLEREEYTGLKLALIEEIEAHLHPQAQLRLIKFLQELANEASAPFQLILSSHSPNLASEVNLENLIVCSGDKAFSMGAEYTKLRKGDYLFLERFLDVTKANLFFARGVIIVEGDAEALLIPTIAQIIDLPLVKHGVSVINVGSKAFTRYCNIFKRKDTSTGVFDINVAVVTDADVIPIEGKGIYKDERIEGLGKVLTNEIEKIGKNFNGQNVKTFIAEKWTLEYELSRSTLKNEFYMAVLLADYIKNSDKVGLTDKKVKKAEIRVEADFKRWEQSWAADPRKNEKIAFQIYNNIMLKKGQLKSITAQCFANLLLEKARTDKDALKAAFENDSTLKYLSDAIKYAVNKI